jgi:putative redox protein
MAETMKAEAIWQEDLRFEATTGTGHQIVLDADPEFGGAEAGPRPIELLLVGYASCSGMDVISILRKMRQPVEGYRVQVTGERREQEPRIFVRIAIEHILRGDLDETKVAHAVQLSEEKFCSVAGMLRGAAELTATWRVEK